jgi:hypothetical protein
MKAAGASEVRSNQAKRRTSKGAGITFSTKER